MVKSKETQALRFHLSNGRCSKRLYGEKACSLQVQQVNPLQTNSKSETDLSVLLGTGKSVLLRAIIAALGGPSPRLAVTASTGIAAINIGGTTLHSFAGCGLGKESVDRLVGKIRGQRTLKHVWERWKSTKTLIIDESKYTLSGINPLRHFTEQGFSQYG